MKKAIKMVLVLALAVLCLTAVAAAAEGPASGICNVDVVNNDVTVKALKADKTEVTTATEQDGKQVYADAVRLEVSYSAAEASAQYVVMVLNDGNTVPTESNVAFIDQNGTATFDVYPGTLENGKIYDVYISSNATGGITAATKVASFGYYAAYTPGDVNEDGKINAFDAMAVINHVLKNETLTGNQLLAANVDATRPGIDAFDAMKIINYVLKNITEF